MSTIIKNIEDFQKYVTVSFNLSLTVINPYLIKADRKFLKPYLSEALFEDYATQKPTEDDQVKVYNLMQEASSNLALLYYTKVGIIHISDSGFSISQSEKTTPAEWWQIRDLRRQLFETGMEAIDEALKIMQASENQDFDLWKNSSSYSEFSEFFIRTTQDFQKRYNINESRITFLNLKPHIRRTEKKFFKSVLGQETINKIKKSENEKQKQALEIAKNAQVDFTLSEIAQEGAFVFKPSGLFIQVDEVSGKDKSILQDQQLDNLSRIKLQSANNHLKELVDFLNENKNDFPEFQIINKEKVKSPIYNNKSIFAL